MNLKFFRKNATVFKCYKSEIDTFPLIEINTQFQNQEYKKRKANICLTNEFI